MMREFPYNVAAITRRCQKKNATNMSNFISVLYMALHISIMGVCYLN